MLVILFVYLLSIKSSPNKTKTVLKNIYNSLLGVKKPASFLFENKNPVNFLETMKDQSSIKINLIPKTEPEKKLVLDLDKKTVGLGDLHSTKNLNVELNKNFEFSVDEKNVCINKMGTSLIYFDNYETQCSDHRFYLKPKHGYFRIKKYRDKKILSELCLAANKYTAEISLKACDDTDEQLFIVDQSPEDLENKDEAHSDYGNAFDHSFSRRESLKKDLAVPLAQPFASYGFSHPNFNPPVNSAEALPLKNNLGAIQQGCGSNLNLRNEAINNIIMGNSQTREENIKKLVELETCRKEMERMYFSNLLNYNTPRLL